MSDAVTPAPAAGSTPTSSPSTSTPAAKTATSSTPAPAKATPTGTPPPNSKHAEKTVTAPPTPEQKAVAEKRKYKQKVDGQEIEEELDDTEITVRLQKARAADKRMQESAEVKKAAAKLIEDLKRDPWGTLKDPAFGVDLEALAETRLAEKYRAELMNEEQRKTFELQKQVERFEAEKKSQKDREQAEARRQMEAKVFEQEKARLIEAATKYDLPRDDETLAAMAEIALNNHNFGVELTADQIAAEVNERLDRRMKTVLPKLKGESLLKKLGPDVVAEVLRAKVAEFKAKQINPPAPPVPKQEPADKEELPRRSMSVREWRKMLEDG